MTGLISKGTYIGGLFWAPEEDEISVLVCQGHRILHGGLNWTQSGSGTHYSLKVALLKVACTVGVVGRMYISRAGEGMSSLCLSVV